MMNVLGVVVGLPISVVDTVAETAAKLCRAIVPIAAIVTLFTVLVVGLDSKAAADAVQNLFHGLAVWGVAEGAWSATQYTLRRLTAFRLAV